MRGIILCTVAVTGSFSCAHPALANCGSFEQVDSPNISVRGDNTFAAVDGKKTNDVWSVGQYAPDSDVNITLTFAAHYDGRSWAYIPTPNVGKQANALHSLAVTAAGHVWAVGYYIDGRDFYFYVIEFWDGAQWQVIKHPDDPGASAVFFGVSAVSANDVWAVGEYQHPLDRFHTLIEHFDGTRWTIVSSPDPGTTGNVLYSVKAVGRNVAFAVGEEQDEGPLDRALICSVGTARRGAQLRRPQIAGARRGSSPSQPMKPGISMRGAKRRTISNVPPLYPRWSRRVAAGPSNKICRLAAATIISTAPQPMRAVRNGGSALGSILGTAGSSRLPNAPAPAKRGKS